MASISFTDYNGESLELLVEEIDEIFGFNTVVSDDAERWYYWVCTKDNRVIKSRLFDSLDEARAEYAEHKILIDH